jgi:hypothetical protein
MSIRVLAFALLAGVSLAYAAPPKSAQPKTNPAPTQDAADIDVDALARSKDADAATPAAADAPPEAAPSPAATPTDAPPSETPSSETSAAATPAVTEEVPASAATPTNETAAAPIEAKPDAIEPAATPAPDDTQKRIAAGCQSRATSLLDDAQKADYGNATRDFDAKMRTALPAPQFKKQWESLGQFGKLVARGQSHLGSGDGYTLVMIPLIFEKTNLVAQIACGSDGRIAGFHVTEAPKPQPEAPTPQF